MNLKYLIGGNPCGGTTFTASYLTACGFPCGHERLDYKLASREWVGLYDNPNLAECSYTVGQYCRYEPVNELPLIIIIRNPYRVLNSLIAEAFLHAETVDPNEIIKMILLRYRILLEQSERIALVCHLERDLKALRDLVGCTRAVPEQPITRREHNKGRIQLRTLDLKGYARYPELVSFAKDHDYEPLT